MFSSLHVLRYLQSPTDRTHPTGDTPPAVYPRVGLRARQLLPLSRGKRVGKLLSHENRELLLGVWSG